MTDTEPHPYAAELARRVSERANRQVSIKFRTMLNGFGYFRRTESIIPKVHQHLSVIGLTSDFSLDTPESLDDRIALRAIGPVAAAKKASQDPGTMPPTSRIDSIAKALDATVEVFTEGGSGSGFIVHPDGLVVTARHVVDDDGASTRAVKVRLFSGQDNERDAEALVFRSHRQLDFALLWIRDEGPFPALPTGDPRALRHAQTVFAIGSPAGMPRTVSKGIVGNPAARYRDVHCIQTDAAIDHGNSGGPLITENGEVVGINLWGIGQFDAAKFVVPIDYLTSDIAQALEQGRKRCLGAAYCRVCGHADFKAATWFCRSCGIQGDLNSREMQD